MKPKSNVWKYGVVLTCIVVVLVVLIFGYSEYENFPNVGMPLQDDPFKGNFVGSDNVSLNQPTNIIFTICPVNDAPNTTIKLFLPPDVKLVKGNTEWYGNVKSGEEVQVSVVIQVPIEMRGNIKASVERLADNEVKIWRSYYYLVSTLEKEGNVSEIPERVVE